MVVKDKPKVTIENHEEEEEVRDYFQKAGEYLDTEVRLGFVGRVEARAKLRTSINKNASWKLHELKFRLEINSQRFSNGQIIKWLLKPLSMRMSLYA